MHIDSSASTQPRSHLVRALTCALLALFSSVSMPVSQPATAAAPAAARASTDAAVWRSGSIAYSNIVNCASVIFGSPYTERGVGAYAGQLMDPDAAQPIPGQVYYLRVTVSGLGLPCSGTYLRIDFDLPDNTALAISPANPVYCFYGPSAQQCPQSLPPSALHTGAFYLQAPTSDGLWPLAQGSTFEARIPVITSAPISDNAFTAIVTVLDGNSSPTLRPAVGAYVFKPATTSSPPAENPPTFAFSTPSAYSVTQTSAQIEGFVYTFAFGGTIHFEYGLTPAYGQTFNAGSVGPGGWRAAPAWTGLTANTAYYWRIRFEGTNGQSYLSAGQSFTTQSGDTVVIGNGAPAQCTETALLSELGVTPTRNISFDCGPLPITITLASAINVPAGNKHLDGGNKVTLLAPPDGRHFNLGSDIGLYLKDLTLAGGAPASGCGGAIQNSGGYLELTGVRLINNRSALGGGALCLQSSNGFAGRAVISGTVFLSNTAASQGGGAIWIESGSATAENTDFSGNQAQTGGRGGAVGSNAALIDPPFQALRSGFFGNSAGDGGAIAVQGRQLRVLASTLSGNHANNAGGAILGDPYMVNATVANNSAGGTCIPDPADPPNCAFWGGGIHGSARIANTLIANNTPANCLADRDPSSGALIGLTSDGHNLSSDASCGLIGSSDLESTNPLLQALAQNNGRTRTHALGDNSPAINAGDGLHCGIVNCKDQRGLAPFGVVDIGAFERQTSPVQPTPTPGPGTPTATPGPGTPTATVGPGTPPPTATQTGSASHRIFLPVLER